VSIKQTSSVKCWPVPLKNSRTLTNKCENKEIKTIDQGKLWQSIIKANKHRKMKMSITEHLNDCRGKRWGLWWWSLQWKVFPDPYVAPSVLIAFSNYIPIVWYLPLDVLICFICQKKYIFFFVFLLNVTWFHYDCQIGIFCDLVFCVQWL
jgi:hypothetical protein